MSTAHNQACDEASLLKYQQLHQNQLELDWQPALRDLESKVPAQHATKGPVLAIVVDMTKQREEEHIRVYDSQDEQVGVVQGRANRGWMVIVPWSLGWEYVFYGDGYCNVAHVYSKNEKKST